MTDNQDSKIKVGVQTPPTDRPLTAGDVPLLRKGDVLTYGAYSIVVESPGVTVKSIEIAVYRGELFTFVSRPETPAASEGEGLAASDVGAWIAKRDAEFEDRLADHRP